MKNFPLNILASAWRRWMAFATILGNFQMFVILSLLYYTIFALISIPQKILADPLALRRPRRSLWVSRDNLPHTPDSMRRQG